MTGWQIIGALVVILTVATILGLLIHELGRDFWSLLAFEVAGFTVVGIIMLGIALASGGVRP